MSAWLLAVVTIPTGSGAETTPRDIHRDVETILRHTAGAGGAAGSSRPVTAPRKAPSASTPPRPRASNSRPSVGCSTASRSTTATSLTRSASTTATRCTPMPPTRPADRRQGGARPGHRYHTSTGFAGHYLGDALPALPKWTVSGYQWAPSVWARPDGTFVLYYLDPGHRPAQLRLQGDQPGLCHDDTRSKHGDAASRRRHQLEPVGPVRRRLLLCVRLSLPSGRSHRSQHLHSFRRHALAVVEERRRLLQHADEHLLAATLLRRALHRGAPPSPDWGASKPGRVGWSRRPL